MGSLSVNRGALVRVIRSFNLSLPAYRKLTSNPDCAVCAYDHSYCGGANRLYGTNDWHTLVRGVKAIGQGRLLRLVAILASGLWLCLYLSWVSHAG
jgi:hypothetical protein